jgi:hypothetical protein
MEYEMDKIYVDYTGGRFEAWTYSDGDKVRFAMSSISAIRAYAKKHSYELVLTEEAKLFA